MPAEWEPSGAVLVAWPHINTDWAYMLPEVEKCYDEMVHAISRHAIAIVIAPDTTAISKRLADIPADKIIFFDTPTNDTWTRDYGVITTINADGSYVLNDFAFNAWGGKFQWNLDNGVTKRMVDAGLLRGVYNDCLDFILEGGSIESDGRGTILTTAECLLNANRNAKILAAGGRKAIEDKLRETLGAQHIVWVESGAMIGDDTDSHIDTLARLAPHDTIVYTSAFSDIEHPDEQTELLRDFVDSMSSLRTIDGKPFNLIELPLPDAIYDEDGERIPATYANYLVLNDAILMPTYGQPQKDFTAGQMLKIAYPDHIIEPVDCRALIKQHGSLHCATMQLPKEILPI